MALVDTIRAKLQGAVFDRLGTTITVESVASSSMDKWGDTTPTYAAGSSSQAVPFNYIYKNVSYTNFGELASGQIDIAIPYSTSILQNARVTYAGETWRVINIEDFIISGSSVAKVVRLERDI